MVTDEKFVLDQVRQEESPATTTTTTTTTDFARNTTAVRAI